MHSPGGMTAIPRYILHLFALILLVQGVHAGCISGTISGEPLLFTDPESLSDTPESVNETVMARMAALPLSFIPNEGQTDPAVRYMVKGSGTSFSFTNTGMLFSMQPSPNETQVVITQNYIKASESVRVSGEDLLPGIANYFIGDDPENWRSNIPTYGAVRYHDLYPGIDLLYKGNGSVLKREFIVAPGSDPSLIRMEYEGADSLLIDESGSLNIVAGAGTMTESGPVCFQEIDGTKVDVGARYVLSDGNELTIAVDAYDPAYELVIDPELEYSTYLGGAGEDDGYGIAVDGSGNAYVTGRTRSTNFPTKEPYQTEHGGGYDAFVAKLKTDGSGLVYSTYLGGAKDDYGHGIAVDGSGNAYVTGGTYSGNFPTTNGAYQTAQGSGDAFVTKLNSDGSDLEYSTHLGGAKDDYGYGIAVDGSGNAYVTGRTYSGNFPTTTGANQTESAGDYDAFVTKLNASGSDLVYSTYLGGSGYDGGEGIAVDGSGNAYVTGRTDSDNFPTKEPYQTEHGGGYDAFVAKLKTDGSDLVYSTYLGGANDDYGHGIAVDGSGNAYVIGQTWSADFPTKEPYQTAQGNGDAFVAKLKTDGSDLVYSTYLGGAKADYGYGIAVDGSGNAYVTGPTWSADFLTKEPYQTAQGGSDAFVTKLNTDGSDLVYSTYLGGADYDTGRGIAVDSSGNAYVTGRTDSGNFPTKEPCQTEHGGGYDAFVTKFSLTNAPSPTITSISPSTGVNTGTVPVTINGTNFAEDATVQLTREGQTNITATDVNYVSETQITCNLPINGAATGEWNVTLTSGGQTVTMENGFTVTAPPTITSIIPSTGLNTGTVPVTISGTNFAPGTNTVQLTCSGQTDINATNVNYVSETQITCTLPINGAATGEWNVVLTTAGQTVTKENGFTVTAPPTITSIIPSTGVNTSSVAVTINGTNFATGTNTVQLTRSGQTDINATNVNYVSETQITCTLPINGAATGEWNVVLTTAGQTVTRENGFTVTAPPTITSINPSTGVNTGTVPVTISGTNFAPGTNTVQLTRSGQTDITATDVNYVSETQITCTLPINGAATGEWNVVLTTAGQTVTRENGFTVTAPPTITSINPSTGVNTGTVPVTISGTNFAPGTNTVQLTRSGQTDITATDVNYVSETQITCTLPINGAATGAWNVVLNTAGQTVTRENGFTVTAPPTITSINPSTGVNTGTVPVTISGTNFAPGTNTVQLTRSGQTDINATDVNYVSETQITCTLPITGAATGEWNVVLTTAGQTVTRENGFTVTAPPTITSINPSTGVNTGTVPVTITGTNFAEGATVKLTRSGQTAITATGVSVVSTSEITCTLPITGAATGDWNVVLTTAGQTVTKENGFTVTAPPPSPTIDSINPSTRVNTGPVSVTITGTNFAEGATVKLTRSEQEDINAQNVSVVSETQITCTLPITNATTGDWNVTLTSGGQTDTLQDGFTVTAPSSAPTIQSINPSFGYNTGRLTTIITGTNFRDGIKAQLTRGTTRINGVVSSVTYTQFNAIFPLLGAPVGEYTLTITNTDQTSGTGTFTVRAEQYSPFKRWGKPGSANNQFRALRGIAIDKNGFIYVADTRNHRIVKYNQNGRFVKKWGTRGSGNGKFISPRDVAVDRNNNVYVADTRNHRIQKFNSNGRFLKTWGTRGSGNNQLRRPAGIGVDTKGYVYVADTRNHRIVKYNQNGKFVKKWGTKGNGNRQFTAPRDVAVDNRGCIYVADTGNHRIQKLRPNGAFLTKWGQRGTGTGRFRVPSAIDVGSDNFVYVADTYNHRIQKFSNTGAFLTSWGTFGNRANQLRAPQGLAVNAAGLVYVADTRNHRVSVWRKPAGSLSVESVEEVTPVPTVMKSFETPDVSRPVAAVPVVEMPVRAGHDIRPLSPAVIPQSPAIGRGGIPGNPLA